MWSAVAPYQSRTGAVLGFETARMLRSICTGHNLMKLFRNVTDGKFNPAWAR
jgi:hypothetical protein